MKHSLTLARAGLVAATLAGTPAHARITPEAKPVVDRFVEAAGGPGAWHDVHASHFRAKLAAFGLKGTVEVWSQAPDQRASVTAIGPITIREWCSGGHAWRADASGKRVALDGKDLDQAISDTWFENRRWIEADQGGGTITAGPDETDSLGTFRVLDVTPPRGRPRRLEFDERTGLLVRTRWKLDQLTVVVTQSDFREVGGRRVALKRVQDIMGAAANSATLLVDSLEFVAGFPAERFAPPSDSSATSTWLMRPGLARIPFEYRQRHVWLKVSVDGAPPADFIYDTGAGITVLDSAYAARLGLRGAGSLQAQGGAAGGSAAFASLGTLRITAPDSDGVELQDVRAVLVNVNATLAPFFWRDCAGIIGANVITQFVNCIDFDRRQLALVDPKSFRYTGSGTAVPMTLTGGTPVVTVRVNGGLEGGARLDIGSDAVLDLHTPFVKRHRLIESARRSVAIMGAGIGGAFQSRLARMRSVEIGPYTLRDPLVGLSTVEGGALASEDYIGNLGNGFLDQFVVTLDYDRRQVWLEPGAHYGQRPNGSRLGAQLLRYGDEVRAAQVLSGGPAARAGLRENDRVSEIDGSPASGLDGDQLEGRFEHAVPGSKVLITVVRGGKSKRLTVRLRDIL